MDKAKHAIEGEERQLTTKQDGLNTFNRNVHCCTYVTMQQELANGSLILNNLQNASTSCQLELAKNTKRLFPNFPNKYLMNPSFISWTFIPVGFFVISANPPKSVMSTTLWAHIWLISPFPVRKFITKPSCRSPGNSLPRTLMFNWCGALPSSRGL